MILILIGIAGACGLLARYAKWLGYKEGLSAGYLSGYVDAQNNIEELYANMEGDN